jgi:hypothetical protein
MTMRDPKTGVPILGQRDPMQEARDRLQALRAEKAGLDVIDHDWVVIIQYNLSTKDAIEVTRMKQTGHPPAEPIPLVVETMRDDSWPTCAKCGQTYDVVSEMPCPGMTIEQYLMSLDDAMREKVLEKLRAGEAINMAENPPGERPVLDVDTRDFPATEFTPPSTTPT